MPTIRQSEIENEFPIFVRFRPRERGYGPLAEHKKHHWASIGQCLGKKAFDSWKQAEEACKRRPGREVYRCQFCRSYHVGTRR